MDFTEYQAAATETAVYPDRGKNLYYPALGLNGESGEVAEKIKKLMRDHGGILTDAIANKNIEKLRSRQKRGVINGVGDNR